MFYCIYAKIKKGRPLKNNRNLLFLFIIFSIILLLTFSPISDPDFWWHIRTGQWIAENHSIPKADPFSYTANNHPWIAHEWLSDLFIYFVYKLGGFRLLTLIFSLITLAVFVFSYLRCIQKSRPYIAGMLILLGASASIPFWGIRPQMISLLFSAVFLFLLDRYQETRHLRYLIPIPLLTVLWVNLHGGFLLGLGILGIYILGNFIELVVDKLKYKEPITTTQRVLIYSFCGIFIISLLATLANPNGIQILVYPFQTLTDASMQQFIVEWVSPDFHQLYMLPFALILLLLIVFGLSGSKRISTIKIILAVVFCFGALRSVRHIPLFVILIIPILAEQISSLLQTGIPSYKEGWFYRWKISWVICVLLTAIMALTFVKVTNRQSEVENNEFPKAATEWILQNNLKGEIFSSYTWGGYLIWKLYPYNLVYIDGRMDIYEDSIVSNYKNIYYTGADWLQLLDESPTQLVLVENDSKLAASLTDEKKWKIKYKDTQSILFSKE
ncbi:MAG: hypothetical protein C0410_12825 [Anaerolinea sp.]|nr:hypothetical protein [Anaerolinea sp.]